MAGRFPGADSVETLLDHLAAGVDSIVEVPAERWDVERWTGTRGEPGRSHSRWLGAVDGVERFDARFFNISPRTADAMDPQQRMLLEVVWHCLEDAAVAPATLAAARTGVFVGVMATDHLQTLGDRRLEDGAAGAGPNAYAFGLANRISHVLGLGGPSHTVDAACASSLVALHQARRALLDGECDYALVAAASLNLDPWKYVGFSQAGMLSPTGRCRTFDIAADGYVPGDGVIAVLLRRADAAVRDGERVRALLRGSATGHCAATGQISHPSAEAQARVIAAALADAGLRAADIGCIEAHGTGTSLGDPIEVDGLNRVFAGVAHEIAIGSVKSNIGHLEAAAGLAGVVKAVGMLERGQLLPTLHLDIVNPVVPFSDGPLRPCVDTRSWPAGVPRRVGVSSFGVGGANSHVVLEQAPTERAPRRRPAGPWPLMLSARDPAALAALVERWREFARSPAFEATPLADIAGTLALGRAALRCRIATLAHDHAGLRDWLAALAVPDEIPPPASSLILGFGGDCRGVHPAARWLRRSGIRVAAVTGWGAGVGAASRFAAAEGLPLVDARDGSVFGAPRADAHYLRELFASAAALDAPLAAVCATGRALLEHQYSFSRQVAAWDGAVARFAPAAADLLAMVSPTPQARRVAALVATDGLRQLGRKWQLAPLDEVALAPLVECVELVEAGALSREAAVELLSAEDESAFERHAASLDLPDALRLDPARLPRLAARARTAPDGRVLAEWAALPAPGFDAPGLVGVSGSDETALRALALELWRRGADADWRALFPPRSVRRVALPCYAFRHAAFRIGRRDLDAVASPDTALASAPPAVTLRAQWQAVAPRTEGASPAVVDIVLGDEAASVLGSRLDAVSGPCAIALHWPADAAADPGALLDAPVRCLFECAALLARRVDAVRHSLLLVADAACDATVHGLLGGFAASLAEEFGGAVAAVECAAGATPVDVLPLAVSGARWRVAPGRVERHTLVEVDPPRASGVAPSPDAVALVSGGAGAIGRQCVASLARLGWRRIALLGRRHAEVPEPDDVELRFFACDVADAEALATTLERVRAWGPPRAVVHAAGVLADGLVAQQPWPDARAALVPKLVGGINLDAATRDDAIELFVVHASIVGLVGNAGQCAYGAANGALEGLVEARRARGAPGVSGALAWSLWRDGGMGDTATVAAFERAGVPPLDATQARAVLDAALSSGVEGVLAVLGGPLVRPQRMPAAPATRAVPEARENIERHLRARIAALTGDAPERLGAHDSFFDQGLGSIDLQGLTAELGERYEGVTPTLLFRHGSLAALADHLATLPRRAVTAAAATATAESSAPAAAPTPRPRTAATPPADEPVAIIGMSGRFPLAPDLWAYWDNLIAGRDCIRPVPAGRWERALGRRPEGAPGHTRRGGFIDDVEGFDPLFFNLSVREAERMDPQQRLALENAWHTLEHAGYGRRERHAGRAVGVFLGTMWNEYSLYAAEQGYLSGGYGGPGSVYWQIPNRVSYAFDFSGPSLAIDTACSSSLTAIHLACQALRSGDCEMALAGGVNLSLHPAKYDYLEQGRFLSSDGRCRSFGADGDGYVPGEGVASVLLKPLSRALADGDRVYGVVLGSSVNHGGRAAGFTVPDPGAQQALVERAMTRAGVAPHEVSYVECHGTGTALGDPIEIAALAGAYAGRDAALPIGSVKSAIGHLEAAAGVAGLIKVLLALEYGRLPPGLHADPPNPHIDFAATPFEVLREAREWAPGAAPRIAALSSFGAGGSNAHALVAGPEYAAVPLAPAVGGAAGVVVSARSRASLAALCARLAERVGPLRDPALTLADVAATLALRERFEHAVTLAADDLDALARALREAAEALRANRPVADASGVAAPAGRACSLPGTPFENTAYWLPTLLHAVAPGTRSAPMLPSPQRVDQADGRWRFELALEAASPWLADHDIGGAPVLAAALTIELLRQSVVATGVFGERFELRDLAWLRAISGDAQLAIEVRRDGDVLALELGDAHGAAVRAMATAASVIDLAPAPSVGDEGEDVAALYVALARDGMRYGASYRTLHTLSLGETGPSARLHEDPAARWHDGRGLSPALIDGSLQALLGWLRARHGLAAAVPVAIGRVAWNGALPARLVASARIDDGPGAGRWRADIALHDEQGRMVARMDELVLQATDPRRLTATESSTSVLRYATLEWIDMPGEAQGSPQRIALVGLTDAPLSEVASAWPGGAAEAVAAQAAAGYEAVALLLPAAADGWQGELLAALQILAGSGHVRRLVVGVCVEAPEVGALGGLLRALMRERPELDARLLMVDGDGAALSRALAAEFALARPADPELRVTDGRRQMRAERALAPVSGRVAYDGAWLVTGGLGGLGLIVARHLIRNGASGVAVVGRGAATPDAAQRAALDALAHSGVPLLALAADVSDAAALRAAVVEATAALGPLVGVVHAAGVTRDGLLRTKRDEDFTAVLAPKLSGARALDAATADQPLRHFVLFASISGVRGNVGQTDYAYANRFLDLFAEARERRRAAGERAGRSVSIDWPLWLDGGLQVDARTREWLRESLATEALDTARGLEAFDRALALDAPSVLVTLPLAVARSVDDGPPVAVPEALREPLLAHLLALLATTTKIDAARLDPARRVDDYGVDSVLAVDMVQALEADFGPLSRILFYEHASLAAVAEHLLATRVEAVARRFGASPAASAEPIVSARPMVPAAMAADAPIAVIGLAGRYPDAPDLDVFWRNLIAGHDAIRPVPVARWAAERQGGTGERRGRVGGFLDDVDVFDPLIFGISPRDARLMDPQARLFLECALAALEDGGHAGNVAGRPVGVFAAAMWGHYELLGAGVEDGPVPGSSFADIANRVSHTFGLTGPSLAVDTMCSGSLTALHLACEALRRGECEMALAGGANLSLRPEKYRQLIEGGFLSSDGRCRSFGEGGDGYVPGEGVGVALLKPLDRALADGDAIHGVIRAGAINHGGRAKGYTVPNPAAQAGVVRRALERAGLSASDIDYVETHGTGTALGDPIELAGLAAGFDAERAPPSRPWRIGSVKSQIGHCEAAAGIAGLTRVLLQLRAGRIAPSLHADPPNGAIDWPHVPFRVVTAAEDWPAEAGRVRRAVVSSFGAGGANAHLVIEEAPQRAASSSRHDAGPVLVPLSARTPASLRATAAALADALSGEARGDRERVRAALADALSVPTSELRDDDAPADLGLDAAVLGRLSAALGASVRHDVLVGAERVCVLLDRLAGGAGDGAPALADIAYTLTAGRLALPERLALVVDSVSALRAGLHAFVDGAPLPDGVMGDRAADGEAAVAVREAAAHALAAGDLRALASAWVRGGDLDWHVARPGAAMRVRLPGVALERKSYWYRREGATAVEPAAPPLATSAAEDAALAHWRERATGWTGDAVALDLGADGIARVTMNHQARRNMFDDELALGLIDAFERIAASDARVVLLAGTDEVFSMGGTPEMLRAIAAGEAAFTDVPFFYRGLPDCPLPVISAMAGHAYGGGLLFGLYADLPLLAEESLYSAVFADYGFSPGMGATLLLPERLGATLAAEMMYSARALTGAELRARGAPLRIVPRAELMAQALDLARSLAAKPRTTLVAMKRSLARGLRERLPAAIAEEAAMHAETFRTEAVRDTLSRRFGDASARPATAPQLAPEPATMPPAPEVSSGVRLRVPGEGHHAAPRDEIAMRVIEATARILMMSPEEVADDRPFLEQGLDSIGAAELARALGAALGRRVEVAELYDHPTPRALATRLGADAPRPAAATEAAPVRLRPVSAAKASLASERRVTPPLPAATGTDEGITAGERIAAIAARLLQMPREQLATDLALTDQGLDSIGAVEAVRAINAVFALELEATDLYDHPSVERLAALVEARRPASPQAPAVRPTAAPRATAPSAPDDAIAIIGMACRYPAADDVAAFAKLLREGRDAVAPVPASRWPGHWFDPDPEAPGCSVSRAAGLLADVAGFDAGFFRISPMEAEIMDPQQRIALEQCWRALEDAALAPDRLAGQRCGVFMGSAAGDYEELLREAGESLGAEAFTGLAPSILAARIAYQLDLTGPALSIDTACSSSLVAVHQARRALLGGDCDVALAGGVMVMSTPKLQIKSSKAGMLSPRGRCRPFADGADGIALAEGCGVVVLKRLADALADGDPVHAVLRASGVNQDGATNGITAPSARSQAALMAGVYRDSDIDPVTVGLIETHGTGTALGDPIEFRALAEVFGGAPRGACRLSSVKAAIGHATVAAGVAGLIGAVLAVRDGRVPPLAHFERANARIALDDGPFSIPTEATRWDGPAPRRAAVSSFGFSGTNAHVVIEQAPPREATSAPARALPFLLSAADEAALAALRARLAAWLRGDGAQASLADVATTLAGARAALPLRWACLAADRDELLAALEGTAAPAHDDVARVWLAGARPDDATIAGFGGQRIHLPGYAFTHRSHWIGTAAPAVADTTRFVFAADDALLTEHREGSPAGSVALLAGTAHVALALTALGDARGAVAGLRWFAPFRPTAWPAELRVRRVGVDGFETVSGADDELHASGSIAAASAMPAADLSALAARCTRAVPIDAFRAGFARKGLQLGGRFRSLVELHAGDGEVLGRLDPPQGRAVFEPDPGVLDSALQCVAALIDPECDDDRLFLPVALDRLDVCGDLAHARRTHARVLGGDDDERRFDVDVLDEHGRVLAAARGFVLRRVERRSGARVQRLVPHWRSLEAPVPAQAVQRVGSLADMPDASATPLLVVASGLDAPALFDAVAALVARIGASGAMRRRLTVAVDDEAAARALTGFAQSLVLESPRVDLRVVWLDGVADDDARLDVLAGADAPVLCRLDADGASTLDYRAAPSPHSPARIEGCWIVSGGFGRLGLAVGAHLARRGVRVALVGRNAPGATAQAEIDAIEGPAPLLRVSDLCDEDEVARVVADIAAEGGPVRGVIHAAGVLHDALLANKRSDDAHAVLDTKIGIAHRLAAALRDAPLEAFVCFTSIAALKGQAGQTDYAFANGWLDGLAGRAGVPWRAIAWPWWREGGMVLSDDEVERARRELGIEPLETNDALAALDAVLAGDAPHTLVVSGEATRLLGRLQREPGPASVAPATTDARAAAVEAEVSALVVELLKLDAGATRPELPWRHYGFESITLTRLATRINRRFGLDLSPAVFFEADGIGALAALIVARHGDALAVPARSAPAPEPMVAAPAGARRADANEPIAIIGLDGRFPGGGDLEAFWRHLEAGADLVGEMCAERVASGDTGHRAGYLAGDVGRFDARFFGISPREAELMDPQQRLFLETAWRAIEDAGIRPGALAGSDTGVFAGVATADYMDRMLRNGVRLEGHGATGMSHGMLTNRLSFLLDLHGPSEPVDTSCSSSLVAIARAVEALRRGDCALAIAGGVNLLLSPTLFDAFGQAGMLSAHARCASFDAAADGYVRGEGVGVVVLKRLRDALADGDPIHGVIRAIGVAHGGRSNSLTAPNPKSQARLVADVLARAGVDAAEVDYVETHGTGTPLGDPVEIAGLTAAFAEASRAPRAAPCALGAVKSNIGHLEAAAGIAGLTKVLLALRHRRLPANAHFSALNPHIRLDPDTFTILDAARDWPEPRDAGGHPRPRRAGLSSFGFGGVNAHALIEQVPARAAPPDAGPQLVVLSARSQGALLAQAAALAARLEREPSLSLPEVAWTLQVGREAWPHRLALVAHDVPEAAARLRERRWIAGRVDADASPPSPAPGGAPEAIARAWVAGAEIDWAALAGAPRARVSLPGTVFEGSHFWAEAARLPAGKAAPKLDGALFAPGWQALRAPATSARGGMATVVHIGGETALVERLARRHEDVRVVAAADQVADGVTTLYVVDADQAPDARDASAAMAAEARLDAWLSLLARYDADAPLELALIVRGATDAGGAAPSRPSAAAQIGLLMSVAAERPRWQVRVVDLADGEAQALEAALDADGPVLRAVCGARVLRRVLRPVERSRAQVPQRGEIVVVLGGSGGIAGEVVLDRARRAGARIALIGRRAQDAALRERLAAIGAAGGEVIYLRADATDEAALRGALESVRERWGAPSLVIDATMVLRDATLATMDEAALREAFRAKARPAVALERALATLELSPQVVHMSSVQSFDGNAGQANYAAGCVFLDAWAAGAPGHVRTINWGYWGSVGAVADEARRAAMRAAGVESIEAADGLAALDVLLGGQARQLAMARGSDAALARIGVVAAAETAADELGDALTALEAAVPAAVAATLSATCASPPAFDDPTAWRAALATPDACMPLLDAVLDIATRAGTDAAPDLDALARAYPALVPHVALLGAALAGLPAVLRGQAEGTEILLPGGSPALVEAVYAGNALADAANAAVATACASLAGDGARRFIEVGAGTGGTSAAVLAALAPLDVDEYCYTDLSRAFTQHGWRRFRSDFGFTRFELLDIERDPQAQGFAPPGFDAAIAANVLHATRDIVAGLRHLRALLRPGGALVINELFERLDFNTVTFGLLPGWWRHADGRRLAHAPLLDEAGWRAVLVEAGFDAVGVERAGGALAVIRARVPVAASSAPPRIDAAAVTAIFAEALRTPVAELDRRASFADLGVDSILAGEIAARLGERLDVRIRPTELFNHPSIERLEAHLATLRPTEDAATTTTAAPADDADPLMSLLRRLEAGELDADAVQRQLDAGNG